MDEREKLTRQLDDAGNRMKAVIARIDSQKYVYPLWTTKDVIAHLAGWYDITLQSVHAHIAGEALDPRAIRSINQYNERTVEERRQLNLEQIVREWDLAREELKQALREMPAERFTTTMVFPWGGIGSVSALIENFALHELEHAEELEGLFLAGEPTEETTED